MTRDNFEKSFMMGSEAPRVPCQVDSQLLNFAVECTRMMYSNCKYDPLTLAQTIDTFNPLGSPGLPHTVNGIHTKDEWFQIDDCHYNFTDLFEASRNNDFDYHMATKAHLKTEAMTKEKITNRLGRIFQISPVELVLLTNSFWGGFSEKLLKDRSTWSAYGFVAPHGGMHKLLKELQGFHEKVALDVHKWDKHVLGFLYYLALSVIDSLSSRPNKEAVNYVYTMNMHANIVTPDGDVYRKLYPFHQVSGSAMTTEINIVMHTIILFYHWKRCNPNFKYADIVAKIYHQLYGDNNIGGVKEGVNGCNLQSFIETYEQFGMTLKDNETLISTSMDGMKFLGCTVTDNGDDFTYDFNKILDLMSIDIIDHPDSTVSKIQRFVSLWVMGCQCHTTPGSQKMWHDVLLKYYKTIPNQIVQLSVGTFLARAPSVESIRAHIRGMVPESSSVFSFFNWGVEHEYGPCAFIPGTAGINIYEYIEKQSYSLNSMNAEVKETKQAKKVLKTSTKKILRDREIKEKAQEVQGAVQFDQKIIEGYLPSERIHRWEAYGSSQQKSTQTTSHIEEKGEKLGKEPKEKSKQEEEEDDGQICGGESIRSSASSIQATTSSKLAGLKQQVESSEEFKRIIKLLSDGSLDPTQAYQRILSLYHKFKTPEQMEQELREINERYRKKHLGNNSGMGQKGIVRGREGPSNSNAGSLPPVKSTIPVHKDAKITQLDSGVGIAHSFVGEQSKFGPMTPEALIADKDTARFCGSEFLSSLSTGTPAPTQGMYLFPFLLNPRAWPNTRAQLESLNWLTYKFNSLSVRYLPVCPTTTSGGFLQYFNTDVDNNNTMYGGNLNVRVASDYANVTQSNVWSTSEVGMENFQPGLLYCDMNGENRFTYAGQYLLMAMGSLPENTSLGNLYVSYDITFHGKALNPFNGNLVQTGSVTLQKLYNASPANLQFDASHVIGGSLPPANAKCQIVVYSNTNVTQLSLIDNDSGTNTFTLNNGSNLFCYMNYTTGGSIYFFRKPSTNPLQDNIVVSAISGGSTTITLAFTWYVYQDVL
jgi:hypothetical protein